ncbi:MAG: hypothetical protein IJ137_05295 [Eubacterium sp.]|nr:hypothetical protein [Eubacterium sp.]
MSEFGDISRMNLSELERKGMVGQDIEEDIYDEADTDDEVMDDKDEGIDESASVDSSNLDDQETAGSLMKSEETGESVEAEVIDEKEHMAAPVGKHYYIDAEITAREMRAFLFAHNYRSPVLFIAILVGVVWPIYTVLTNNGSLFMAIFCAAIFLFLMPFSIWYRGGANVKQNPTFRNTFHYMLDEAGLHLELGEKALDIEWKQVIKAMYLGTSTAIYTGKTNAFLIPTSAMGNRKEEINSFIKAHI